MTTGGFPILTVEGFVGRKWVIDDYFIAGENLHCGDVVCIKDISGAKVYRITINNDKRRVIGIVNTPKSFNVGDVITATNELVPIVISGITKAVADTSQIVAGDPLVASATIGGGAARVSPLIGHLHKLGSVADSTGDWTAGEDQVITIEDKNGIDRTFNVGKINATSAVDLYSERYDNLNDAPNPVDLEVVVGISLQNSLSENAEIDVLVTIGGT